MVSDHVVHGRFLDGRRHYPAREAAGLAADQAEQAITRRLGRGLTTEYFPSQQGELPLDTKQVIAGRVAGGDAFGHGAGQLIQSRLPAPGCAQLCLRCQRAVVESTNIRGDIPPLDFGPCASSNLQRGGGVALQPVDADDVQSLPDPQGRLRQLSAGQVQALAAVFDLRVCPAPGRPGVALGLPAPRLQQRLDFRPGETAAYGVRLGEWCSRGNIGGQQQAAEQEHAYHNSIPSSVSMA